MATIAIKVYDFQWYATFGMTTATAAAGLREDGVDTVLIRNQIDPLPNSGVDQEAYLARTGDRMAGYDDGTWTDALRAAGLRVYQTTATFFDPAALTEFPDARPINADGNPDRGYDWYVGICPTHDRYLTAKIDRLRRVAADLEPDGLFLSFTRYPGFWENWVPDYAFSNADRFCFCARCRARFAADVGIGLPPGDTRTQAKFILAHCGQAWTAWRCARLVEAVARIVTAVREERPNLSIMLNTLPFPASDFAGLDARREIAGQDLAALAPWIDRLELMTYLQILRQSPGWLEPVLADARQRLPADRELLCTLQVAPLYTEGVHAGRGRTPDVTADDLDRAAKAALDFGADGLVFYHWTDFLVDEAEGGRKWRVLRAVARDHPARLSSPSREEAEFGSGLPCPRT